VGGRARVVPAQPDPPPAQHLRRGSSTAAGAGGGGGKRKDAAASGSPAEASASGDDMAMIATEVVRLKQEQRAIDDRVASMWRRVQETRNAGPSRCSDDPDAVVTPAHKIRSDPPKASNRHPWSRT